MAGEQFSLFDAPPPGAPSVQGAPAVSPGDTAPLHEPVMALLRHPRANREAVLGDWRVAYEFQRGQRRTIGLSVGPLGLSVRAPRWTPLGEVERFLHSKADWVRQKLQQMQQRQQHTPAPQDWLEGADVPYLGRQLRLVLDPAHGFAGRGAQVVDDALVVGLARDAGPERLRDTVQAWLMREARQLFAQRLDHFAPRLGVQYTKLSLTSAATRWGSASADGSIRLNWRLIHLSMEMIDYVVAHELSHLREMNHSPDFWGVVHSVMPDYAERRRALKQVRLR